MTTAVGRKIGVTDGDGVGVADTSGTRGEAIVVGTGFTVPATKAVALGDATGACPGCFIRAFFSKATAAKPSAAAIIKAKNPPARTTLKESFRELR